MKFQNSVVSLNLSQKLFCLIEYFIFLSVLQHFSVRYIFSEAMWRRLWRLDFT